MERPKSGASGPLLPEIEGLRALAVLSVLLYHAHLGFSGGYVGVDVFFVVSGFLITGLLQREFEGTGRISLREFYARRARRLLPAATLVLVVTLVLSNWLLDPIRSHRNAVDTMFAAGFIANFRFAATGADYFQQALSPSTLQHWWSLAVEEQFYLVWPGLLAGVWALVARGRRPWAARASALALIGVLGAVSFVVGWRLTGSNPSWGYFATWSRVWELSVGAGIAFVWSLRERIGPAVLRAVLGWAGLLLIAYAALRFDGRTAFPGTAAWVPVAGTVLVLGSIGTRTGPGALLSVRPMQWLGGRSYGLYLWHWPVLVLLEARVTSPGPWARIGALAAATLAAAASYRFVENPVRHRPSLLRSPWRSVSLGITLSGLAVAAGAVGLRLSDSVGGETGYVAPVLTTVPVPAAPITVPTSTSAGGATSPGAATLPTTMEATTTTTLAPRDELERRVRDELQPFIEAASRNDLMPDNLRPPLREIPEDKTLLFSNGCMAKFSALDNPTCQFGDTAGSTTIVLFGDSHVAQWFPGLDTAGERNNWKILALTKMGCPSAEITVGRYDGSAYTACNTWRKATIRRIVEAKPALVVLTNFRYSGVDGRIPMDIWKRGLRRTVAQLVDAGLKVLLLSDSPSTWEEQSVCIARHRKSLSRCNIPRNEARRPAYIEVDRAVAEEFGAMAYEVTDWMCTSVCPAVIGDVAVYLDRNHITNTYGEFLSPYLELVVRAALAGA